jgi:acyl-CoA thioesterase I
MQKSRHFSRPLAMALALLPLFSTPSFCQDTNRLVSNLNAGKKQVIVTYGTSLTAAGKWVKQISDELDRRYPGLATVINRGENSKTSHWGLENLQSRVIDHHPDAVFIEFSINDADAHLGMSLKKSRKNLKTIIDRILAANKSCEIILMVMNPPTGPHLNGRKKFEAYNQVYREVAKERNLILIDHDPAWQKILKENPALFSQYVPDGIHPNWEGCKAVVTPKILSALGLSMKR